MTDPIHPILQQTKKLEILSISGPLYGMVICISGIENPERSIIRQKALELGAEYSPLWTDKCTHLICPFKNTPKIQQMKLGRNGIGVYPLYIYDCYVERARLKEDNYLIFPVENEDFEKVESSEADEEDNISSDAVDNASNYSLDSSDCCVDSPAYSCGSPGYQPISPSDSPVRPSYVPESPSYGLGKLRCPGYTPKSPSYSLK